MIALTLIVVCIYALLILATVGGLYGDRFTDTDA